MPPNRESKGTRLTGINPLAYMGVEPSTPPQLVVYQNSPTNRDINYNLGTLWVVETPFEVWMLINKTPQNATKWILIYPQGDVGEATLFPTDDGTAQADAITHELNILGGNNINTAAPGNINNIVVNLNETIIWPSTNSVGDQGVIYLGGERYFHNFGDLGLSDNNTFLGRQSGNFSLTGTDNTGIGAFALNAATIGGNFNTALGSAALISLQQGSANIAVGSSAGSNYTNAETGNIAIGHDGITGEDNTIHIGTQGAAVAAHIAGINGVTVAGTVTPNTLVNVDDDGQLGQVLLTSLDNSITFTQTDNGHLDLSVVDGGAGGALTQANFGTVFSQPFSYVQVASTGAIAGNTTYQMGSLVALTQIFDVGGNVFPGNGAGMPAVFTAPATGKYYLEFYVLTSTPGAQQQIISIVTTARTYRTLFNGSVLGVSPQGMYTVVADMTIGDTATFTVNNNFAGAYTVVGNVSPPDMDNSTRISGYRIA